MRSTFLLKLFVAFTVVVNGHVIRRDAELDSWIAQEADISWKGVLRNIGPNGEYARGVNAGAVVASPSKSNPDYWYQWTRDTALTFKVLLNEYLAGNQTFEQYLREYAAESYNLQHTNNPSGGFTTGGIGEPKFHVNGAPYTGGWGRPQNDGPAVRATVLTAFANKLLDKGETAYVRSLLYDGKHPTNSVIKADLEHISHNWQKINFDLWEEVNSRHFFNYMVQHRALIEGAELATRLGDSGAASWYNQQAAAIARVIPTFWNPSKGFIVASEAQGRSGVDCGTLLGSLHGNGRRGFGLYPPHSDEVLLTLEALVNSMKNLYPINSNTAVGTALGRYPEDVYDGVGTSAAHPWFICTLTGAEVLYQTAHRFTKDGSIKITSLNQNFYRKWVPNANAGATYSAGSSQFNAIINGLRSYGDSFVKRVRIHVTTKGEMSEQFSRYDGFQQGAKDLTWSYAAFVAATKARAGNQIF